MAKKKEENEENFEEDSEEESFGEQEGEAPAVKKEFVNGENFEVEDIPGIGSSTAKKMREAGYKDAMGIATSSPVGLAEVCEIGEATARKIIEAAR
jgi:hypothetical protein